MAKLAAVLLASLLSAAAAPRAGAAASPVMPPFPVAADDGAVMLWLRDNTSLGVGRFVAFGPDNVLVVLTDEVSTRTPNLHQVSFRQEATKLDFVSRTGGRSIRGAGEIDCTDGSFKTETLELFSGSDLRGDRITAEAPEAVGRIPRTGSGPAIAAAQVCGTDGSAFATLANTGRRAPAARSTPAVRAAPPSASAPLSASAPPKPRIAPMPAPRPTVRSAAKLTPAAPVLEPEPPRPPAQAEVVAQIGAFNTDEAAERAWRRLADLFPSEFAGKAMQIEPADLNGAPMFRSEIGGFATPDEAEALCARLMASSEPCFVRKGP